MFWGLVSGGQFYVFRWGRTKGSLRRCQLDCRCVHPQNAINHTQIQCVSGRNDAGEGIYWFQEGPVPLIQRKHERTAVLPDFIVSLVFTCPRWKSSARFVFFFSGQNTYPRVTWGNSTGRSSKTHGDTCVYIRQSPQISLVIIVSNPHWSVGGICEFFKFYGK